MSKPEDIVQPGHIFPLRARAGGVLPQVTPKQVVTWHAWQGLRPLLPSLK